jgi:hypothetical protein
MRLFSQKTLRTMRESLGTFLLASVVTALAILLSFVEDFCRASHRPQWLCVGVECFAVILFIADSIVLLAVVARVLIATIKDVIDRFRDW